MSKVKISKLISQLILILSFSLLFYIFYKSELVHLGKVQNYYLKYYIFSIFFIMLAIVSFFISYEVKLNVLLLFCSFIIIFFLIELFLIYQKKNIYGVKDMSDDRSPMEVYKELKSNNFVLYLSPSNFLGNPNLKNPYSLSGISNSKTIWCNENGYYVYYNSDRYGFGNPDDEWDKKSTDYLVIGDSFGKGACVNEEDSISGNLRNYNNSVLNLSNSGNGPLTQYATLREYLGLKNVKKILWIYYEGNDLFNLEIELKNKFLINYISNGDFSQNLYQKQDEIDNKLLEFLNNKFKNYNFSKQDKSYFDTIFKFLKLTNLRKVTIERNYEYLTSVPDEFEKILKLAKILSEKNGSELYFIYLPDLSRYERRDFNNLDYLSYGKILQIVSKLEIKLIDLNISLFSKLDNQNSLRPYFGAHFNKRGYSLISEAIYNEIVK